MILTRPELELAIKRAASRAGISAADHEAILEASRQTKRLARGTYRHEATGCRCPVSLTFDDYRTRLIEDERLSSFATCFDAETSYAAKRQQREDGRTPMLIEVTG